MSDDKSLLKLLNASGYAFQLGVEAVAESSGVRGVEIVAREHPWSHRESGRSGFIDLVIEKGVFRIVIECKRTMEADWLFLSPSTDQFEPVSFYCHWSSFYEPNVPAFDWGETYLSPEATVSQFCSVRGQGEGHIGTMDRIGSELVYATEALAAEERSRTEHDPGWVLRYIPVVVTNANLQVATFDPHVLDPHTGRVEDCEFASTSVVQYRKALDSFTVRSSAGFETTKDSNRRSQRSLFVVNASELPGFLDVLSTVEMQFKRHPWRIAQEQYRSRKRSI